MRYVSRGRNAAWCLFLMVQGNVGLCGYVPACLASRIPSLNGTSLMDPSSASRNPQGGLCDNAPPTCSAQHGCGCALCLGLQAPTELDIVDSLPSAKCRCCGMLACV